MSYRVKLPWRARFKALSPFGLGIEDKPKHYRAALDVVTENRGNLNYAWKILSRGVCDACPLGTAGFHDWTIGEAHLCLKRLQMLQLNTMEALNHKFLHGVSDIAWMNNDELRKLGRLPYPMRRRHGEPGFTRITWDDAYQRIADQIRSTEPERLAFFLGARGLTNEAYYMAQKVARFLGTNNIDTAGRLAHSPSTAALRDAIGVDSSTCSYEDLIGTDLVVFFDSRPATDQPVMTNYLHWARRRGARVVVVGPHLERDMYRYWAPSITRSALWGSKMADHWFPVARGGETAYLYGVLRALIEEGWHDESFINQHTEGFDALKQRAQSMQWDVLEEQSRVERGGMAELARLLHKARSAVFIWNTGAHEHELDAPAVQMVMNTALSKGFVGRKHCGLLPMPMHTGLPGAKAMGAYATGLPGNLAINAENATDLASHWGFKIPETRGLTASDMVEAGKRDQLSMLYCVGGNFLAAEADAKYVRQAMERVPLRVHQDVILTEQMFIEPKRDDGEVLLLPAKTMYEQKEGGTQTSAERRVMFSPEMPREVGETRSEWRIFLQLAQAVNNKRAMELGCTTGPEVREEIAKVVPAYHGIQYLENVGDAFQAEGPRLCEDWQFPTHDHKAHFQVAPLPRMGRKRGTFEASAIADSNGSERTQYPADAILVNAADAADLHLKQGDRIALGSQTGRCEGHVHLAPIPRGQVRISAAEAGGLLEAATANAAGAVEPSVAVRIEVSRSSTAPRGSAEWL